MKDFLPWLIAALSMSISRWLVFLAALRALVYALISINRRSRFCAYHHTAC